MYVMGVSGAAKGLTSPRDWPSLAEVARAFGASLGRVETVSAQDSWPEQREAFRRQLRVEEDRLLLQHLASKHVRARVAAFRSAMKVLHLIESRLQQEAIPPGELYRLLKALRACQEVSEMAVSGCC